MYYIKSKTSIYQITYLEEEKVKQQIGRGCFGVYVLHKEFVSSVLLLGRKKKTINRKMDERVRHALHERYQMANKPVKR